jgi:hypothetical protein
MVPETNFFLLMLVTLLFGDKQPQLSQDHSAALLVQTTVDDGVESAIDEANSGAQLAAGNEVEDVGPVLGWQNSEPVAFLNSFLWLVLQTSVACMRSSQQQQEQTLPFPS